MLSNRVAIKRHAHNHRAYSVVTTLSRGNVSTGTAELTLDEALKMQAKVYKYLTCYHDAFRQQRRVTSTITSASTAVAVVGEQQWVL